MSSTASGSIDRRDAGVAAALAGAVVVVLGYASGVGIQTSGESVLTQQPPAVQPAAPQDAAAPVALAQPPVLTAPVAIPVAPPPVHQRPTTQHNHTPVEPTPTPEPEPEPTPTDCRQSLLAGLPVAGPLVETASSLLFGVVEATPVVAALADPLACTVGTLVATTCCAVEAAATRVETRR